MDSPTMLATAAGAFDFLTDDQGYPTHTSDVQRDVEVLVVPILDDYRRSWRRKHSPPAAAGVSDPAASATIDTAASTTKPTHPNGDSHNHNEAGGAGLGFDDGDPDFEDIVEPDLAYTLERGMHVAFLRSALRRNLPSGFVQLDASRPWIIFWIVHALDLLGKPAPTSANPFQRQPDPPPPPHQLPQQQQQQARFSLLSLDARDRRRIVQTLARCQHPEGGFGGGPGQLPHLATTYAAVHALAVVGGSEAYDCIDRENMLRFLLSMKQEDGSFRMFDGGEIDVRGSYCAMTVARLLNILVPELTANVAAFVASCQTWEGGIGSVPGLEAHGGYAFCGLAACEVLRDTDAIDVDRLVEWAAARQMAVEGGFQGRTNKLVDGCYSLWQGALFQILGAVLARRDCAGVVPTREVDAKVDCLMNRFALQEYILACCQDPVGGLLDKPEKNPDYYHTCYCLSGLSVAQHQYRWEGSKLDFTVDDALFVLGDPTTNAVAATHPVHNIRPVRVDAIRDYFIAKDGIGVADDA